MQNGTPAPPPNDARLTLTTLGAWSLSYAQAGEPPAPLLGPGKPLALLAYLAFAPGRAARREHLVDLLWADLAPDAAAHAMRQTIWLIRRRLGHETVKVAGDTVRLACALDTDVDAFLAAVEGQQLEAAVELYRGEFLPSFAAPGGAEFEKWADLERNRVRALFVKACHDVARRLLGAGHPREALELARRGRDADPHMEASWRLVLEACVSANDTVGAALEADRLEQLLAGESREPEAATRSALRTARHTPSPEGEETGPHPLVAELVGREREFKAILKAWTAARLSPGCQIHVFGGPGLGKTRLLHDVLARLRASGARAVYLRANPGARNVAYAFASDVATRLAALPGATGISQASAASLVALNPALGSRYPVAPERSDGDEALRHRSGALVELLAAATAEGPVALLLDDAHWMDESSRRLLRSVLPKLEELPALVVTAARPGTVQEFVASSVSSVPLRPLDEAETTAVLASLGDIPAESWWEAFCSSLQVSCRGVPLLILETLQLAMDRRLLVRVGAGWSCPDRHALLALVRAGGPLRHRVEQVSRSQRWLLLLLAVAGAPLDIAALAAASRRKPEDVDEDLTGLEQRGLLARAGGEWEPAHDEVAWLAIETAAPEAVLAAHSALGLMRLADAERDPQMLVHAGQHLAAAGMDAELGTVARLWTRYRRKAGDRRPLARIAADLLGDDASAKRARDVVRRLPLSYRLSGGHPAHLVAVAGAVALAAAAAAIVAIGPRPRPDAVIVAMTPLPGDSVRTEAYGVRLGGLAGRTVLDLASLRRMDAGLPRAVSSPMGYPARRPGGNEWVYTRVSRDAGGMDVYTVGPDGLEHRLTATRGDDAAPQWAPDGSRIVFASDRWSALGHSALAVMDADGGHVRRLTRGEARDNYPVWSPDGTRIAFLRRYYTAAREDVCWVAADGSIERCRAVPGAGTLVGWRDVSHVIVDRTDSSGALSQVVVDLATGGVSTVARGSVPSMTPDGRWLLTRAELPGSAPHFRLIPLDRPDLARPIVAESLASSTVMEVVSPAGAVPAYLDSLRILGPASHEIPIEGSFRLVVLGADPHGERVTPGIATWSSSDARVATVDSSGVVHPRRAGEVTITASAGGWRSATTRLRLGATTDSMVFREVWREPLDSNWVPFGDPRPVLDSGPGGVPSLRTHGDSSFTSGVYSRRGFDASRGLGLQVRVSTPMSRTTWQNLYVELDAIADSVALASWDHVHGGAPNGSLSAFRTCSVALPAGEGSGPANDLAAQVSQVTSTVRVAPALRSGRWWTLRLQIFPDGRCGVAINGRPVWRSRATMPVNQPLHLFIHGYSYDTRILAGPLEVWRGVRRDVDWERAPGS
jgi:DNA-binding SARP family transcriptional activator